MTKLNAEVVRMLATLEMKKQLAAMGAEPVGNTPAQKAKLSIE